MHSFQPLAPVSRDVRSRPPASDCCFSDWVSAAKAVDSSAPIGTVFECGKILVLK